MTSNRRHAPRIEDYLTYIDDLEIHNLHLRDKIVQQRFLVRALWGLTLLFLIIGATSWSGASSQKVKQVCDGIPSHWHDVTGKNGGMYNIHRGLCGSLPQEWYPSRQSGEEEDSADAKLVACYVDGGGPFEKPELVNKTSRQDGEEDFPLTGLTSEHLGFLLRNPWDALNIPENHQTRVDGSGGGRELNPEESKQLHEYVEDVLLEPWNDANCGPETGKYDSRACAFAVAMFGEAERCLNDPSCTDAWRPGRGTYKFTAEKMRESFASVIHGFPVIRRFGVQEKPAPQEE